MVERVVALQPTAIVRGNHDKVASGIERPDGFNAAARRAAQWTYETLSVPHRAWLAALPAGPRAVGDLVEICHGSPFDEDTYVFDEADASRGLHASGRPLCLFGHTHHPITFVLKDNELGVIRSARERSAKLHLEDAVKYLLNPGSVGQPRDNNWHAAYAIYDASMRQIEFRRCPYDVNAAQRKIVEAGLPPALAERLSLGL